GLGPAQRHEDVERFGVMRFGPIDRRRVRLARRRAGVARDEVLAARVDIAEGAELIARIDAVPRRRRLVRVRAADDPRRSPMHPGDETARLVRRRLARVGDDLVTERRGERETLARYVPPAIAGMTMTSLPSGTGAS